MGFAKILPAPGEGTHVIPDPRTPLGPCPSPSPLPPTFGTLLPGFIKLADDFAAMKNWYTALTPAEQETYRERYQVTLGRFSDAEAKIAEAIVGPLDAGNERPLYALLDFVRKTDPIRARAVFLGLVDKLAGKINMDYINDPQNPVKGRRARDIVMIRTWIGRN